MSSATDGMEEIVKEFLAESAEVLDLLDRDLVGLERDPESRERLAEIFRAVHTIKGSSGMLGYPKLESVAHAGESLLGQLREGKLAASPHVISGLLAMVDALRGLLNTIERTGEEGVGECTSVVRVLEELLWNSGAAMATVTGDVPADAGAKNLQAAPDASVSKIRVEVGLLDHRDDLSRLAGEHGLIANIRQCSRRWTFVPATWKL